MIRLGLVIRWSDSIVHRDSRVAGGTLNCRLMPSMALDFGDSSAFTVHRGYFFIRLVFIECPMNIALPLSRTLSNGSARLERVRFALKPSPGREAGRGGSRARNGALFCEPRQEGPGAGDGCPLHFQNGTPNCTSHMYTRARARARTCAAPLTCRPATRADRRTTAADELGATGHWSRDENRCTRLKISYYGKATFRSSRCFIEIRSDRFRS